MATITKDRLRDWCSDWCNCYWVLIDGQLENTGDCPGLCDEVSEIIFESEGIEDVTDMAEELHRQLGYEVRRNDCILYRAKGEDAEVVVAYYGHRFA